MGFVIDTNLKKISTELATEVHRPSRMLLAVRTQFAYITGRKSIGAFLSSAQPDDGRTIGRIFDALDREIDCSHAFFASCVALKANRWEWACYFADRASKLIEDGSVRDDDRAELAYLQAVTIRLTMNTIEDFNRAREKLTGAFAFCERENDGFGLWRNEIEAAALLLFAAYFRWLQPSGAFGSISRNHLVQNLCEANKYMAEAWKNRKAVKTKQPEFMAPLQIQLATNIVSYELFRRYGDKTVEQMPNDVIEEALAVLEKEVVTEERIPPIGRLEYLMIKWARAVPTQKGNFARQIQRIETYEPASEQDSTDRARTTLDRMEIEKMKEIVRAGR